MARQVEDGRRSPGAWLSANPHLVGLGLVLLLAAALRFWGLGRQSLWWDEGYSVAWSQQSYGWILDHMAVRDYHPPEYYFALHAWMGAFGATPEAARALSAVFGLLGVLAVYWLGRDLFSRRVGVIAALLVAVSLFHLYYSQEVRSYSLLFATAVLSMHAYWRLFFHDDGEGTPRWALPYFVAATLALLYTHNAGLYVVAAQVAHRGLDLAMRFDRAALKQGAIAFAAVGVLYVPWLLVLSQQVGRLQEGFWMKPLFDNGAPDFTVGGTLALFAGSALAGWLLWLLVLNGVAKTALGGLNREANPDDRERYEPYPAAKVLLLVGWFAASLLLPYIQSLVSQPIYVSRIIIPALAPFLLLAAVGLGRLRNPAILAIGVALAAGLAIPGIADYHTAEFKDPWREATAHIDGAALANATILFYPPHSEDLYNVYSERALRHVAVHAVPSAAEAANMTAGAGEVWVLGFQDNPGRLVAPLAEARGDANPNPCQPFQAPDALKGYPLASNAIVVCRFR